MATVLDQKQQDEIDLIRGMVAHTWLLAQVAEAWDADGPLFGNNWAANRTAEMLVRYYRQHGRAPGPRVFEQMAAARLAAMRADADREREKRLAMRPQFQAAFREARALLNEMVTAEAQKMVRTAAGHQN
jgi:hypothetical protein